MSDFPVAGMVVGAHRVGRVLGAGPHGITYAATPVDDAAGVEVALTILIPSAELDAAAQQALADELTVLAGTRSAQVLIPREHGVREGRYVQVSTLFGAGSLQHLLDTRGPLPRSAALAVGAHVALALHDAHSVGVFHGAVKPANVFPSMRAGALVPVLADFGSVRRGMAWRTPEHDVARSTHGFAAPELLGGGVVDVRSDVYSLGCLIFALRAGHSPYDGPAPARPTEIPQLRVSDSVDEQLNELLTRALQPDPAHRFSGVDEMGARLGELAAAPEVRRAPAGDRMLLEDTVVLPPIRDAVAEPAAPEPATEQPATERPAPEPAIEQPAPEQPADRVAAAEAPKRARGASGAPQVSRRALMVLAVVAAVAAIVVVSVLHRRNEVPRPSASPSAASSPEADAKLPKPSLSARSAYRAVNFVLEAPEGVDDVSLQVDRGSGWEQVDASEVSVTTPMGGTRACLSARAVSGDLASDSVRKCGTSRPPRIWMSPIGSCSIGTTTYTACYRLHLRGFEPGTVQVESSAPDSAGQTQHYTDPVEIGADGTGVDPARFGTATQQTVSVSVAGVDRDFTIGP